VGSFLVQVVPRLRRLLFMSSNTVSNSLRNIVAHYDVSNDLFSGFLSADMNYSCPIWSNPATTVGEEALESAQLRKVHNIIRKARIKSTDHVLDIGCGWAHLAIEAVRLTGCQVTGTTLSVEQKRLAEERIRQVGFADKITILLCDYRETPFPEGGYDKIVSVEMLEHVGEGLLPVFFGCISQMLKVDDGLVVIQGITEINDVWMNHPNFVFLPSPLPLSLGCLLTLHCL
jgi:cyclopropane-fatty-acyl-phospholipid synthase